MLNLTLKILKVTFIVFLLILVLITIFYFITKLRLNQIKFDTVKVEYIKEQNINVLGLNDSQSVNINSAYWEPSFIEYFDDFANIFNASSLKFNKLDHVDGLLNSNLSLGMVEEINRLGAEWAFGKIGKDFHSPLDISYLGNLFKSKAKSLNKNIKIKEFLSRENVYVVYYSGANDLMWDIYNDPITIQNCSKERLNYAKEMANEQSVDNLIDKVENNFKNILSINPNAKIIVMTLYVPKNIDNNENLKIFCDYIELYNKKLTIICNKYNAIILDNTQISVAYGNSDFHISELGHKFLAKELINIIYSDLKSSKKNINETAVLQNIHDTNINAYIDILKNKLEKLPNDMVYKLRAMEIKSEIEILNKVSKGN